MRIKMNSRAEIVQVVVATVVLVGVSVFVPARATEPYFRSWLRGVPRRVELGLLECGVWAGVYPGGFLLFESVIGLNAMVLALITGHSRRGRRGPVVRAGT